MVEMSADLVDDRAGPPTTATTTITALQHQLWPPPILHPMTVLRT